ncbi:AAA family ATPase [Halomonas sp. CnH100-B]|uniref:ATP-dependent nuclease n=1 Tax=Halomonas sp. CnH100-B TaxID=2954490 RepID=UPI002097492A|nr:AAA family ATPase [Halomonas sp. CnH100-B]MCO7230094.1 AAA family ATPase [Halomonas sp. CnH100-B]
MMTRGGGDGSKSGFSTALLAMHPKNFNYSVIRIYMSYRESNLDRNLRKWFANDFSKSLLRSITLRTGNMRGLSAFHIDFEYPITAIAGKNGSGKSTILALSSCAYHNKGTGFKLPNRKTSYYTFADFFIQHSEDLPPQGIEISYGISYNNWKKTDRLPNGVGIGYQTRRKKRAGKWNDYASRLKRDVVFLGIERIVPHNEKSQSKSYSRSFSHAGNAGWEVKVKDAVGKILGKKYDDFKYVSHSKYRLPIVSVNGDKYSGFNMGAGENALFEVFSVMHSVSEGALIVIDEIELGLHSEAQKKFVRTLKELCKERSLQIICTTHSRDIFSQLPDDARIFIETTNGKSIVTPAISPDYAFSKLSAENSQELSILVEDRVAKSILLAVLPSCIRARISLEVIGSASALSRQLAASYNRENRKSILVIFDGDQKAKEKHNLDHAFSMSESRDKEGFKDWALNQITYLPGDTWPESWLVQKSTESIEELAKILSVDLDELEDVLERGLEAGKHDEFNEIGTLIGLDESDALNRFCINVAQQHANEFSKVVTIVENALDG